jgi:hypothetical protein
MFFNKLSKGILGSRCPINTNTIDSAKKSFEKKRRVILFKPVVSISTYRLHKTLFDIAKDEIVASAVLE